MQRRSLLALMGAPAVAHPLTRAAAAALGVAAMSGCANRRPRPNPADLELRRIAMMPIKETAPRGDVAPFVASLLPRATPQVAPPPLNPSLLGMAIGAAMRNSQIADREALTYALSTVNFVPKETVATTLADALSARNLPVTLLADEALAEAVRASKFAGMPTEFDAVLDVQIVAAGYYPAKGAGGFSPTLYLWMRLFTTAGVLIDDFTYEADYRDAKGATRFFTTPRSLSMPTLDAIRESGAPIRDQMTALSAQLSDKLASDLQRIVSKQARLA
jgi:hypothetical protein